MYKSNEVEDLIAKLCLNASTEDIKFCLRIYEYNKCISQIHKENGKAEKAYYEKLQITKNTSLQTEKNENLAPLIICRIQNLLSDVCAFCRKRYSIKILETLSSVQYAHYIINAGSNYLNQNQFHIKSPMSQ